ncbi:MAG TPA: FAD-dependent oxidoreductase [Candidatus Acidoferrum sp.]|nr:FAD-dependent oxidoreductase [Candidatus Acidoferrum sp.]
MKPSYNVPIVRRKLVAFETTEIAFDISKTMFRFTAGQYATITLPNTSDQPVTSQFHDFSIASSPNDHQQLRIAIRNSTSFFKTTLLGYPLHTTVVLEGPSGVFTLPTATDIPLIFIAGGIGITPFMSMLQYISETHQNYRVTLFYANRNGASTAYAAELQELATRIPALKLVLIMTDDPQWQGETRRLNAAVIKEYMGGNLDRYRSYTAGPPAMVTAMQTELRQTGIKETNIIIESFTGYGQK